MFQTRHPRRLHAEPHAKLQCHLQPSFFVLPPSDGESRDDALLPDSLLPQTKVPLYGRDHISSLKAHAMKQAKDRKKQLARLRPTSNLDFPLHTLDKLEPEFVSEEEINHMNGEMTQLRRQFFASMMAVEFIIKKTNQRLFHTWQQKELNKPSLVMMHTFVCV